MARNVFQQLYHKDLERAYSGFTGVILDNTVSEIPDLQNYFQDLRLNISQATQVLISYHNPLWEPILLLASKLKLRRQVDIQNWVDDKDIENVLYISGFEVIKTQKRFFGLTYITFAKPAKTLRKIKKEYSVSIIIPAKNEADNIPKIIPSIPKFGKRQEIIFVEGGSKDRTWKKIQQITNFKSQTKNNNKITIRALKQNGHGKADAVWQGLQSAKGAILMIYDADRTVDAKDYIKFYEVLKNGSGRFANGNRLLYPMENDAMRTLNKLGNHIFSKLFTAILGQRFKDTLCGTKAFFRSDFKKFKRSNNDPFGDFDLIFGAIRSKLKVVEIPVKYKERVYGSTNINRFYHGLLLVKMTFLAFLEFKL